jgi:hypothetical protein
MDVQIEHLSDSSLFWGYVFRIFCTRYLICLSLFVLLAYFINFENMKLGLWNKLAACVSLYACPL